MSETISGDDAYKIYLDLDLKKPGVKSASFETVEAILNKKGVKIRPKPSDLVRQFFKLLLSSRHFGLPFTSLLQLSRSVAVQQVLY